ncbi:MAG: DUF1080 domain-containing protein [Verrucomicrobia bacterium]|nr:DUF1080 domain-containing protein [Verrucomicrobiota bacterium]
MRKRILIGACAAFALFLGNDMLAQDGFENLFNGKDLDGWDGNPKFWSVEDGMITGRTTEQNPTKGNTFLIYRKDSVDDFELRLKYRMVGGNSGIQYRSTEVAPWVISGYQADIDSGTTYSGIMYHERGRGILAQRGQVTKIVADPSDPSKHKVEVVGSLGASDDIQAVIKPGEWNDYTIIAHGNQMTHVINGRVTSVTIDEHPAGSRKSGVLALQLHAGPPMLLQVKDVHLRRIR